MSSVFSLSSSAVEAIRIFDILLIYLGVITGLRRGLGVVLLFISAKRVGQGLIYM